MNRELSPEELAIAEWQTWIPGFGIEGQKKLANATVMISRVGGVGGAAAYALAAAGVGKLVLAHAGNIKPSDLNRQWLMTHDALRTPRLDSAIRKLTELNPRLEIDTYPENVSESNASALIRDVDVVVCCAPMFQERLAMNAACVQYQKPMVDGAMYEMTGQLTTIIPGQTACLACRVPEIPETWKRQFPVLGAVAGTVGMLSAVEAVKLIAGLGEPLADRLLSFDLRDMRFRTVRLHRRTDCRLCGRESTP